VRTQWPPNTCKIRNLKHDLSIFQYRSTHYLGVPGLEGTLRPHCPHHPPQGSPSLPKAQDTTSSPWGPQPLPQRPRSRACLQLPTALPGHGLLRARPTHSPRSWPGLVLASAPGRGLMPGAGAARVPPSAQLLAGAGQALADKSCPEPDREALPLRTSWQAVHSS